MVAVIGFVATTLAAEGPATSAEIVVWGNDVDEAREAVAEALLDRGYTLTRRRDDGATVYRHEDSPWKGRVIVDDDGWMLVRREPLRVEGRPVLPGMERNSAGAWAMCVVWPFLCVRAGGAAISGAKFRGATVDMVEDVGPLVNTWNDRVADRALAGKLDDLPALLAACWEQGRALDGARQLDTATERRADIAAYWTSRTDTSYGDRVRDVVDAYVRAVIQTGEAPYTPAEIDAINAGRDDLRRFPGVVASP